VDKSKSFGKDQLANVKKSISESYPEDFEQFSTSNLSLKFDKIKNKNRQIKDSQGSSFNHY
jgi:hypothetical protein